jgi:uncharacterized protein YodC (DUF2158 family)
MSFDPNRLSANECELGRVVSLRSGGPKMTISAVSGDLVECVWFDKVERHKKMNFHRSLLQKGDARSVMLMPPCPDCVRYAPLDVRLGTETRMEREN